MAIRVLPVEATISGYWMPRSAYSIYTYPDPGDPTVVAVDTTTTDHVLLGAADTTPYLDLFDRLRDAALSRDDSRGFRVQAAQRLAERRRPA
jgi:hypothetical protein